MIKHLDDDYWIKRRELEKKIKEGRQAEAKLVRLNYSYAPPAYLKDAFNKGEVKE